MHRRICSALGEAKIVPATEAESRPGPTKEANEGSWPEPPPEMSETWGLRTALGEEEERLR